MRAACAIFAGALALVLPRLAVGQAALPGREMLRLDWRAPAGCPSAKAVRDAAIRSSGAAAAETSPLDVRADVEHGARWRVTIQTSRDGAASATRSLEAASCSALAEATAAVLGVALIPAHPLARTEPEPSPTAAAAATTPATATAAAAATTPATATAAAAATTPATGTAAAAATTPATGTAAAAATTPATPTAAAAAAAPAAPPPPTTSSAPLASSSASLASSPAEQPVATGGQEARRFALGIELAGNAGVLPAIAPGARVALAWTPRAFRVEVAGGYFSGQSRTTDGSRAAGARFGLLTVGGRGCWAALRGGFDLGPCAGVDIVHMTAGGFGAPTNFDASGTWAAGALGGLARIPLTRSFALRADLDAIVPFSRPRFVVENDGAVHKPAGVGARAAIGAELNFL